MRPIVKVCGMTDAENIREVEALGVDLMGFIFYPKSPRCLSRLPHYMPVSARRVGVFVNESRENVLMYADRFELEYLQLHGNESPEYCQRLQGQGVKLIKAFSVASAKELAATENYEGLCSYYLFDTPHPQYGGSGNSFDWSLLHHYQGSTPFLLSGGINRYSVPALRRFNHPRMAGIDLNSRFETRPGFKDAGRIREFLDELMHP